MAAGQPAPCHAPGVPGHSDAARARRGDRPTRTRGGRGTRRCGRGRGAPVTPLKAPPAGRGRTPSPAVGRSGPSVGLVEGQARSKASRGGLQGPGPALSDPQQWPEPAEAAAAVQGKRGAQATARPPQGPPAGGAKRPRTGGSRDASLAPARPATPPVPEVGAAASGRWTRRMEASGLPASALAAGGRLLRQPRLSHPPHEVGGLRLSGQRGASPVRRSLGPSHPPH